MRYKTFSLLIFSFISCQLSGQSKYYDSLVVDFGKSKINSINLFIDTVIDARNDTKSNCLGIWEKKKYLFVPIDNFLQTKKSLASEIKGMFQLNDTVSSSKYRLKIEEFNILAKKNLFLENFTCDASISVYSLGNDNKYYYSGTLMYETTSRTRANRKNEASGYEDIIDKWKINFMMDINRFVDCRGVDTLCGISNYKKLSFPIKKNLYSHIETFIGEKSWLLDGEIIFSRPETEKKFYRQAYCVRYRNDLKYESFETTLMNLQQNMRLSSDFIFTFKRKLFMGLNRWKGEEYKKHGLEDIFLFDLSLSQSITYNPLNRKGITAAVGVMENVTFIYSEDISFKPYLVIQFGIKL